MQKVAKKSPSVHYRTTLLDYIFVTKARIDSWKKVKQQYLLHMSLQYGDLRPTKGLDLLASLGHPSKFQGCLAVSWAGTYMYTFLVAVAP